jgi:hypothetical protein
MKSQSTTYHFPSDGLGSITKFYCDDKIILKFGEYQSLETFLVIGLFLFEAVSLGVQNDSTAREFEICSEIDGTVFCCVECLVRSAERGSSIDFSLFEGSVFVAASVLTGKQSVIDSVASFVSFDVNEKTAIPFLRTSLSLAFDFVAGHFSGMKGQLLELIGEGVQNGWIIRRVLGNGELRIADEGELMQFCLSCFDICGDPLIFEFIIFEHVPASDMRTFVKRIPGDGILALFGRLSERMVLPVDRRSAEYRAKNNGHRQIEKFGPSVDSLFKEMKRQNIGITCTSSSIYSDLYKPQNALEEGTTPFFCSVSLPHQFWRADFDRSARVEAYTLIPSPEAHYPRSWILEASDDGIEWRIADRQQNFQLSATSRQVIKLEQPTECRAIRLTLTGKTPTNSDYLDFSEIILKGSLELDH